MVHTGKNTYFQSSLVIQETKVTQREGGGKPVCVIHYKWMGGTDFKDQLLKMYLVERKLSQMVFEVIQKSSECHSAECYNL